MAKKKSIKSAVPPTTSPVPECQQSQELAGSTEPQPHPKLYFDESDTRVFQVENVLFKLHPLILRRYCEYFREILTPAGDYAQLPAIGEGEPRTPVTHVHGYLTRANAADMPLKEFELAVRLFYPETLLTSPIEGESNWTLILDASQRWQSPYLRAAAILNLEKLALAPHTRLELCTKYGIDHWVEDICTRLCRRQRPLDSRESDALGRSLATAIRNARIKLLTKMGHDLIQPCPQVSSHCSGARLQYAQKVFGLLHSSSLTFLLRPGQEWEDVIDITIAPYFGGGTFCGIYCKHSQWQLAWKGLVKEEMQQIMQIALPKPVLLPPDIPVPTIPPSAVSIGGPSPQRDDFAPCPEPKESVTIEDALEHSTAPLTPANAMISIPDEFPAVPDTTAEYLPTDAAPVPKSEDVDVSQALDTISMTSPTTSGLADADVWNSPLPCGEPCEVYESIVETADYQTEPSLDDFVLT